MKRVIFIGGVHGRTGTSVVKRILCHHPDVSSVGGGETRTMEAICDLWPNLIRDVAYTPLNALEALAEFTAWVRASLGETPELRMALDGLFRKLAVRYVRLPGKTRHPLPAAVDEALLAKALHDFVVEAFTAAALNPARPVLCEKTPSNALYIRRVQQLMPEARMIVMVRDPIAVALSHTRRDWGPTDPVEAAVYTEAHFRRWRTLCVQDENCLLVRHEELVENPKEKLAQMLDHLCIDRDATLLAYAKSQLRPSFDRTGDLTPIQLSAMQSSLRDELKVFGYDLT